MLKEAFYNEMDYQINKWITVPAVWLTFLSLHKHWGAWYPQTPYQSITDTYYILYVDILRQRSLCI